MAKSNTAKGKQKAPVEEQKSDETKVSTGEKQVYHGRPKGAKNRGDTAYFKKLRKREQDQ